MKRILYLFDDINYTSGAQKAMFLQMEALRAYYQISVFSLTRPQPGILPEGVVFGEMEICGDTTLFARSFREVVKDRAVPPKEKICRIIYGIQRRFGQEQKGIIRFLTKSQREWFESFFAVVVSEASKLRWFAAGLKKPKKSSGSIRIMCGGAAFLGGPGQLVGRMENFTKNLIRWLLYRKRT